MEAEEDTELISMKHSLDAKTQELYSANMQLQCLTANVAHLESENGELRHEIDEKEGEIAHLTELCQKNAEQISSLQMKLKASVEDKEEAQRETERRESDLKLLAELNRDAAMNTKNSSNSLLSASMSFNDGKMSDFQDRLAGLEEEKAAIQAKMSEAVMELQKCMDDITELRQENSELKEEVECIQYQLSSQCDINERLRQEIQDLRFEEDTDSVPDVAERKGNSLFSEVEDRRIVVEKRMVKLQEHVRHVEENLTKEVKENERLKGRIRQLRQAANKVHNEESVRNILHQLEESKKKIAELTASSQKMEKQPPKTSEMSHTFEISKNASVSDKRFCGYIESLMTQSKQEMEAERSLHEQTKLQLAHCDLLLTQKNNELIAVTLEKDRLKSRNFDLSTVIRDLQRKYEPECHDTHKQGNVSKEDQSPETTGYKENGASCKPKSSAISKSLRSSNETPPPSTGSNKENSSNPTKVSKPHIVQGMGKSVALNDVVNILSEDGSRTVDGLKPADGEGTKLAKNGKGTGKYKSISYATNIPEADSSMAECTQQ